MPATYAFVGPHGDVFYPAKVMASGVVASEDAYPGDIVRVTLVFALPDYQVAGGALLVTGIYEDKPSGRFFATG